MGIHLVLEYYKTRLYQKRIYQYVEPKPYEDKGQYNMPKTPHALLKKRMADKIISYGAAYSCHFMNTEMSVVTSKAELYLANNGV